MNKNKLIVLLVLLVAVVGLTLGTVTAGSTTTKTKYKVVKVNTKFNKIITKKAGKYKITTYKEINNGYTLVSVSVTKNKKVLKGNTYYTKAYYKENGKSQSTTWRKGLSSDNYHYYSTSSPKTLKIGKIGVKFKVTVKNKVKKSKKKK